MVTRQECRTLRAALDQRTVDQIRPRARFCAELLPTRKGDLIGVIVKALTTQAGLKRVWEQLDAPSRQVVAAALDNEGVFDDRAFRAQHGRLPWDALNKKSLWSYQREYLPLDVFLYSGCLPTDLLPQLRRLAPPVDKLVLTGQAELPHGKTRPALVAETEQAALHDLAATLGLIAEGQAALTPKGGRPAIATLKRLAERLLSGEFMPATKKHPSPEPIRARGWLRLVETASLARATGAKLVLTTKGKAALAEASAGNLQHLLTQWQRATSLVEQERIPMIERSRRLKQGATPAAERKSRILAGLAECPLGRWIKTDDFFRALRAWRQDFRIDDEDWLMWDYPSLYGDWTYRDRGDDHSWRSRQGQYVLACLWEALGTLGALDLAYDYPRKPSPSRYNVFDDDFFYYGEAGVSPYAGLRYFRLNPLGAYLLGRSQEYSAGVLPGSRPAFIVTPNYEIAITQREQFTPNVRALLERVAEPVSVGLYRLERGKLLSALETGLTLADLTSFLAGYSAQPLPKTVSLFLDDLQRNSQAIKEAGSAVLFTARDAPLAALLARDSALRKFCQLAGDATLVIPANKVAAFRRRLKQLGFGIRG